MGNNIVDSISIRIQCVVLLKYNHRHQQKVLNLSASKYFEVYITITTIAVDNNAGSISIRICCGNSYCNFH